MAEQTERELQELADPAHPRQELSPMGELGLIDRAVRGQRVDEHRCVIGCDKQARGPSGGVGTPKGEKGPDPVDSDLHRFEPSMGLLEDMEHVDVDERLPDLF